jgi:hypothetical protein
MLLPTPQAELSAGYFQVMECTGYGARSAPVKPDYRRPMNIYFSCSITGGRNDQAVYQKLTQALLDDGHIVPTAHLADEDISSREKMEDARDIYIRDSGWVKACDAVVAEVTTPSHGVGYEIALAECSGKPVFMCHRAGVVVSKMLTGNPSPGVEIYAYTTADDAIQNMRVFLNRLARE